MACSINSQDAQRESSGGVLLKRRVLKKQENTCVGVSF